MVLSYVDMDPVLHNGSAEKPVLCDACSSEYKFKGILEEGVPQPQLPNQENVDGGTILGTPNNHVPTSDTATSSVTSAGMFPYSFHFSR